MSQCAADILAGASFLDEFAPSSGRLMPEKFCKFARRFYGGKPWLNIGLFEESALSQVTHCCVAPAEAGKASFRRVEVAAAPPEELPYPAGVFRTVSFFYGLSLCRSDAEALVEINRVTKRGGRLVISVPCFSAVIGRPYGDPGFPDWVRQFGFRLVRRGPSFRNVRLYLFEKEIEFGPECWLKPQFVPVGGCLFRVANRRSLEYWKPGFEHEDVGGGLFRVKSRIPEEFL